MIFFGVQGEERSSAIGSEALERRLNKINDSGGVATSRILASYH